MKAQVGLRDKRTYSAAAAPSHLSVIAQRGRPNGNALGGMGKHRAEEAAVSRLDGK